MTGLVGWWPLHRAVGDAVDLSGNGHDGTITGTTRGVAGRGGLSSYSFDGSDDEIVANGPDYTTGEAFTVSLWASSPSITTNPLAFGGTNDGSGPYSLIYVNGDSTTNGTVTINHYDGTNRANFDIGDGNMPNDEWVHVVFRQQATDSRQVFVNATQETSNTVSVNTFSSASVYIGGESGFTQHYPGALSDIRVYDRALSDAEIQRLYEWGGGDYAEPPSDVDDADALSYWTLDEDPTNTSTATDSWGTADGTINGATQANPAIRGTGLSFDGTDDRVETGENIAPAGPFSVATWTKFDNFTSANTLLSERDTSTSGWHLVTNSTPDVIFRYWDGGGNAQSIRWGNAPISTGEWYHFAGTYNGSDLRLYCNAELVKSGTGANSPSGGGQLVLGRESDSGTGNFLSGDLDDVRVYGRALSSAEIHDVYRYGTFGRDLRKETVTA